MPQIQIGVHAIQHADDCIEIVFYLWFVAFVPIPWFKKVIWLALVFCLRDGWYFFVD
jgi:hypothetical protein